MWATHIYKGRATGDIRSGDRVVKITVNGQSTFSAAENLVWVQTEDNRVAKVCPCLLKRIKPDAYMERLF